MALTLTATVGLGGVVAPSLADTGSVFYDANFNVGAGAFLFNGTMTGGENVGLGYDVMPSLTTGGDNVATGMQALYRDTSGNANAATGWDALYNNSSGSYDVATGKAALFDNTTGHDNTALGYFALTSNSTGHRNLALGSHAGQNLTTGSDNVDLASAGIDGESGTIRIGTPAKQTKAFLAGVYGNSFKGQTVVVNENGRLGTAPAVAAPLRSETRTVDRLRGQLKRQRAKNYRQDAAIQRLRELIRRRTR